MVEIMSMFRGDKKPEQSKEVQPDNYISDVLSSLKKIVWLKSEVESTLTDSSAEQSTEKPQENIEKSLDKKQKKVYDRLKRFEQIMPMAKKYVSITDGTVPLETIVWLIPAIWDVGTGTVNAGVMAYFGNRLSMWMWYQFKNLAVQTVDTWVGVIPLVWDAIDVFFKSNRRMYKNFLKAYDRLIKKAEKLNLPSDIVSKAKSDYETNKLGKISMTTRKTTKDVISSVFGKTA